MSNRSALTSLLGAVRRTGRGMMLVALASVLAAGCSGYFWTAPKVWAFKGQLESVAESAPHGTLAIERNNKHVYLVVDGKAVFRSIEGNEATFRLSPGRHTVIARYVATEGNSAVTAGPIEHAFDLSSGGRYAVGVEYTGSGIRFVRP